METVPSIPSRADRDLAEQATAAGWPTSADQVRELREQRAIPPSRVLRRGRGKTKTAYPPGALAVLVAIRQAAAEDATRRHRALALAWVRGADVPDEALRPALVRMVDDADRMAGVRVFPAAHRAHRAAESAGRQAALGALATLQLGLGVPSPEGLAALADGLAPFMAAVIERLAEDRRGRGLRELAAPGGDKVPAVRRALIEVMGAGAEVGQGDGAQEVADLSGAACRAAIGGGSGGGLPRAALNAERDRARRVLGLGAVSAKAIGAPTDSDPAAVVFALAFIAQARRVAGWPGRSARVRTGEGHGRTTKALRGASPPSLDGG